MPDGWTSTGRSFVMDLHCYACDATVPSGTPGWAVRSDGAFASCPLHLDDMPGTPVESEQAAGTNLGATPRLDPSSPSRDDWIT